jgi:hypothetical protein
MLMVLMLTIITHTTRTQKMPSDLSQLTDSNFVWTILPITGSSTHKILLSSASASSSSAGTDGGLAQDMDHLNISA